MHHSLHFETVQSCTPKILISASHNFCWFWLQSWGFWLKFSCQSDSTPPTPNIFSIYLPASLYFHLLDNAVCSPRDLPARLLYVLELQLSQTHPKISHLREKIAETTMSVFIGDQAVLNCACARRAPPFTESGWGKLQRLQQQRPITFEIQKIDVEIYLNTNQQT